MDVVTWTLSHGPTLACTLTLGWAHRIWNLPWAIGRTYYAAYTLKLSVMPREMSGTPDHGPGTQFRKAGQPEDAVPARQILGRFS